MHYLRVFIVVLQELHCLSYISIFVVMHEYTKFHLIAFCVSELHAHICPYHNVWPEAVYCCFVLQEL